MSVVRDFCGHGLGRLFHDEPNIVHVGRPGEGIVLKPGMFFTVEPMINLGRPHVKVLSDGWTAVTRDRSLSAQFEHSVGVTDTGVEVFTLSPKGYTSRPIGARLGRRCSLPHRKHVRTSSRPIAPADMSRPVIAAWPLRITDVCWEPAGELMATWSAGQRKKPLPRPPRPHRIITAIASGCVTGFAKPAPRRCRTTNCWNWCCFARCPT